jgi:3-dehydroquinate dehydratase-2
LVLLRSEQLQEIYVAASSWCSVFIALGSTMPPTQILRFWTWIVTILIVQGPHVAAGSLGSDLSPSLHSLARAAGQVLSVCKCSDLHELVGHIRAAKSDDTEFMLLDPGDLAEAARAHPEEGLDEALDQLASPYVEVHDDSGAAQERPEGRRWAPLATIVINGDLETSYRIAMGIALRRLAA